MEYFETMFAALEKGYRPCLRCRPDMEIAYHTSNPGGSSIVDAALRLVYDGYLNDNTLADLAARLNVSQRHLRTLFVDNLGVPPIQIARYHKALFARKLLSTSNQPISQVAFASGFGSIRQFNETIRQLFQTTPSEIRKHADIPVQTKGTTLLLRYRKPFDFGQVLDFLRPRAIAGVERVTEQSYSRTFRTMGAKGFFSVRNNPQRSALELSVTCDTIRCLMSIHNRVRRMFDLDTDFSAINKQFADDTLLGSALTNGHAPRLPVAFDPFEFLVRAILGQQITVKAATTLAGRVAKAANNTTPKDFPDGLDAFFPTPDELIVLSLDAIGLTATRQQTLRTATQAVLEKRISLSPAQPFEDFHKALVSLKGIGDWTAHYMAMRGLGMMDSFPASDLGIIKALQGDGPKPRIKDILRQSEQWRPYRAYAALCLWKTLEKQQ